MNRRHVAGRRAGRLLTAVAGVALGLGLIAQPGCGSGAAGPATHPVQGQVFVGQRPAVGAMVVLSPLTRAVAQFGHPRGYVDAEGSFRLTTHSLDDGAPTGSYAVAVIWRQQHDEDAAPGRYLADKRYANPDTSGLRVDIHEGHNELEPIVLNP